MYSPQTSKLLTYNDYLIKHLSMFLMGSNLVSMARKYALDKTRKDFKSPEWTPRPPSDMVGGK